MSMEPYAVIIPDSDEQVMALMLDRKMGRIPKGTYGFIEFYCTDKGCDCRRVTIVVLNEKMQEKAVISMGFDPDDSMAGPFLDDFHKQSSCAGELLGHFVRMLNEQPQFLEMMYRHYREVRAKVDGKPYRGKPFPKPGTFVREAAGAPDLPGAFKELMETLAESGKTPLPKRVSRAGKKKEQGLRFLVEQYLAKRDASRYADHAPLQDELRRYLLDHDSFGDELAGLLVEFGSASPEDDDQVDAALHLLHDALEILRVDLERQRPGSRQRMDALQNALARRVFDEYGEASLCAAVSHALLQSRVEALPVLREASSRRILLAADETGPWPIPEENPMDGLFRSIEELGHESPYEALETLLQLMALGPAEMQTALCGEMLVADNPLIRDAAALMILHPTAEVRLGAAQLLADHAARITPDTLRRLIITRNWFPEEIRTRIDQAVSSARRGRVECAPLAKSLAADVYASPVDGAGAQSFQVIVPDGKGFLGCSILIKAGAGVVDAFVISLSGKREKNDFISMMFREGAFIESSQEYLDLRVCHGLAEGAAAGKAPTYWLAHVAETLGKDQWKAVPFDPLPELAALRKELELTNRELLSDKARDKALEAAKGWPVEQSFADSWFEDDAEVDRVVGAVIKKRGKKRFDKWEAVDAILDHILEKRRAGWLNCLTLCTLWLKSSRKPPVPWHQMFHVASAVADTGIALVDIPLMESIAIHTLGAYLGRREEGRG
uniref:Uncharacterized protein n=1 Tax=Geobacter metallireducens TaxID=28232 RepID=A0A831UGR7_GEOME